MAAAFSTGEITHVQDVARDLQREEFWRAQSSLDQLRLALARLYPEDSPKVALYFGDILRFNPGEHYIRMVPQSADRSKGTWNAQTTLMADAAQFFDAVLTEAAASGVRVYSVYGMGHTEAASRDIANGLNTLASDGGRALLAQGPQLNRNVCWNGDLCALP